MTAAGLAATAWTQPTSERSPISSRKAMASRISGETDASAGAGDGAPEAGATG